MQRLVFIILLFCFSKAVGQTHSIVLGNNFSIDNLSVKDGGSVKLNIYSNPQIAIRTALFAKFFVEYGANMRTVGNRSYAPFYIVGEEEPRPYIVGHRNYGVSIPIGFFYKPIKKHNFFLFSRVTGMKLVRTEETWIENLGSTQNRALSSQLNRIPWKARYLDKSFSMGLEYDFNSKIGKIGVLTEYEYFNKTYYIIHLGCKYLIPVQKRERK